MNIGVGASGSFSPLLGNNQEDLRRSSTLKKPSRASFHWPVCHGNDGGIIILLRLPSRPSRHFALARV